MYYLTLFSASHAKELGKIERWKSIIFPIQEIQCYIKRDVGKPNAGKSLTSSLSQLV